MNFQPNTTIRLCATDLMLGNGHQIIFNTKDEQTTYFMSKVKYTFSEQTYQRVQAGIMYLEVNVETLNTGVNYIMFQNENYSNKWFYANILKLSYVNPNTTRIDYALDSFQSFMFDINLEQKSYIDRRHYKYSVDGFNKIMTLPYEDLDIGNQYVLCDNNFVDFELAPKTLPIGEYSRYTFYLLVSSKDLTGNTNLAQTFRNSLTLKKYENSETPTNTTLIEEITTGLYYYVCNGDMWDYMLLSGFWTSVANNGTLQQVVRLPFGESFLHTEDMYNKSANISDKIRSGADKDKYRLFPIYEFNNLFYQIDNKLQHYMLEHYISSSVDDVDIKTKTGFFDENITSSLKAYLMRYPYSLIEINDYRSNIINYKIQDFNNGKPYNIFGLGNQSLKMLAYANLGSTMSVAYQFLGYKNTSDNGYEDNTNALWNSYDFLYGGSFNIFNSDFSLPIISDYQNAFLQANQNQINAQRMNASGSLNVSKQNANASLQANQLGANLSYQNAQIGADTQMANAQINGATALTNAGLTFDNAMGSLINGGINSALSGVGSIASGNLLGGLTAWGSGASNAITNGLIAQNNLTMSQNSVNALMQTSSNSANAQMLQAQNALTSSQAIMNTNYANTLRNANLEYQSTIRSINARIEDISNMPDTVQQMGSGSIFNYMYNRTGVNMRTKTLPKNVLNRLSNYFMLYGFKSNSFESIRYIIDVMDAGCFIKSVNATILGDIPQENLREIIKMFDNGIMLWKGASNFLNWQGIREQ